MQPADHNQSEESRITSQADRFGRDHQAVRHACKPRESEVLLPIRPSGGLGCFERVDQEQIMIVCRISLCSAVR